MTPVEKIEIITTELVWPGKYNEDGTLKEVPRVSLPFQVIGTVNESRATRKVQKVTNLGLFDLYRGKEGDTFEANAIVMQNQQAPHPVPMMLNDVKRLLLATKSRASAVA
jgi:hypothetical protein